MKIPYNDLSRDVKEKYIEAATDVIRSGDYILGQVVTKFENDFSKYIGTKYCIGVASGLDALIIGMRALGIKEGDEVIVSAHSFIACIMGITINGAIPVFVDCDIYGSIDVESIESVITKKTKAILAVHMYGQPCDMEKILAIANKYNLYVIEDCAQAHGSEYNHIKVGNFGIISCFSFYPGKNFGAYGDGGCICTNNIGIDTVCRTLRNYGKIDKYTFLEVGYNSRLDSIQAAILAEKLKYLDVNLKKRIQKANYYLANIHNPKIQLMESLSNVKHTWHIFPLFCKERDRLQKYLTEKGIETIIHYKIPPYENLCYLHKNWNHNEFYSNASYIADHELSIPLFYHITQEEQEYIVNTVNDFE